LHLFELLLNFKQFEKPNQLPHDNPRVGCVLAIDLVFGPKVKHHDYDIEVET
jgi:hypothetical protein